MRLSLCMIVKNAEATLERALSSVVDLVDEMVIVDTGSTDGTMDILHAWNERIMQDEPFTFRLFSIEWQGFAHARNFSMDQATGDMILILDSDEYISKGHEYIREAANEKDLIAGKVNVLNQVKAGPVLGERIHQMRLFRNVPEIRWEHAIHNQIEDNVMAYAKKWMRMNGKLGGLAAINAEIVHTGYDLTNEGIVDKYSPRLDLLRQEIRLSREKGDTSNEAYFQFQYALMLHMLFSMEEALSVWEEIDFTKLNATNRWYAHYTAARANLKEGNLDTARRHCNGMYAAQNIPGQVVAKEAASHMITGVVLIEDGEREAGLKFLIQAFLDNLTPQFGTRCILNNKQILQTISEQYDDETALILTQEQDATKLVEYVRELQRDLEELPAEVLEVLA